MKRIVVTGSSGLIGSEVCTYFSGLGWEVHGFDNNNRALFFGPSGDTRWNQQRLECELPLFTHHEVDIRDRSVVLRTFAELAPNAIVHTAAQPSHDLAAKMPFEDFDTNAVGSLNLLEATRRHAAEAAFVYMSTNKVYGDSPNETPLVELTKRWDYSRPEDYNGITEHCRVDQSKHSLFGASKLAADVMVQEYGRYFGMRTCCLRGGCLTGPNHSGVELHGFLSYLIKCNVENRPYTVYGYKGKQVRDNIHARDVANFIACFIESPRCGEVYNLGGGRGNSCSILEAFDIVSEISGQSMKFDYVDKNREGDHICYVSDLAKIRSHYPHWSVSVPLSKLFEEIYLAWRSRAKG